MSTRGSLASRRAGAMAEFVRLSADDRLVVRGLLRDPPVGSWIAPSAGGYRRAVDEVLADDSGRRVVRVGDTVRRPVYPWSTSVHLLLEHLESIGFEGAPRFLGIDDEGREVLSFVEGICGADGSNGPGFGAHVWAMVVPDEGLQRFARALRDYHDAVAGFVPPSDTTWAIGAGPPSPGEVICHNDIGPWNVVWRDASPVAFIDWDYAAPAPAIDDVAYALWWAIPFAPDEECMTWRRFTEPPHRPDRIEVFVAAYGLTSTDGLVDAVIDRQRKFRATVVEHAERGVPGAVAEVADGYLDTVDGWIGWSESNRHLVDPSGR